MTVTPGADIPFEVDVPVVDERRAYNLDVHVDMDRSGFFSPGDMISMDECPVLTRGAPSVGVQVSVNVIP